MNKKPTKKDLTTMSLILSKNKLDMIDKTEVLSLIKKYINANANFCLTCDASVRLMVGQLKHFYKKYI